MSFARQVAEFCRRDLLTERRAGEVVSIVTPFGAVALMSFPLAFGIDSALLSRVGPAVFWVVVFLFTMQIALRHSAAERPQQRAVIALLGVDPFARLLGRTLAAAILILVFMAILFPAMLLFYSPDLPDGWPVALIPGALAGIGLAQVGTLAAEVTAGLRTRTTLAPLIVAPLAVPLLLAGSQALESLASGGTILPWTVLVVAADLALAVIGAAIARPLEEASL